MAPITPRKTSSRLSLDDSFGPESAVPASARNTRANKSTTPGRTPSLRRRIARQDSDNSSDAGSALDDSSPMPSRADLFEDTNTEAVRGPASKESSGRSALAFLMLVAVVVLAMSTQNYWMEPHQLPLLRYHQKRAPLAVVNSGSMVYAIDSGRIYSFDFRSSSNPTFAIDIDPSKLNPCQSVQIQVADGGCSGDTYTVLLDGVVLGSTAPVGSLTCNLRLPNNTIIDMTDPSQQTTLLFPGRTWDPRWSSGRFSIPAGQHVLEIQQLREGDKTGGSLVMSTLQHECAVSPNSRTNASATALYRGVMDIDRTQHVFYPNANTEWVVTVPTNGSCVEVTVIDAVCGGDRWNLEIDGAQYGNSSAVYPLRDCATPNLNEGLGSIEWFDLVRPPVPNNVHSRLKFRLTAPGNRTLRFYPLNGQGSDGRYAYYWITYFTCANSSPAITAAPWTETAARAPTTTVAYTSGLKFVTASRTPVTAIAPTKAMTSATATSVKATETVRALTTSVESSAGRKAVAGVLAGLFGAVGLAL